VPEPGWYDDPQAAGRLRWWNGRDWTDQVTDRPTAPPPPGEVATPATPKRGRAGRPEATRPPADLRERVAELGGGEHPWPQLVALGAAAVLVGACFLPWAKVGVVDVAGVDTNDWIYFVVAAVAAVWATLLQRRHWPLAVIGVVTTVLWFGANSDVQDRGDQDDFAMGVSTGIGLWLVLLAALAIVVAGTTIFLRAQAPPPDADQRPRRSQGR
jgi:hypothetical protein